MAIVSLLNKIAINFNGPHSGLLAACRKALAGREVGVAYLVEGSVDEDGHYRFAVVL